MSAPLEPTLRLRAAAAGFDACRITSPHGLAAAGAHLAKWVEAGAHGDMAYMADTLARRADPLTLWPQVRSIVMLAVNYAPDDDALAGLADPHVGNISVYARHRDYHDVIKGRLKTLAAWLAQASGAEVKVFVDTAPVMEKPLAAAAGVGWQGKHTNLVSRDFGSWLFLGSIFTAHALTVDPPEQDHCGTCRACLDVCPTNAFPAPYQLDAQRCISYLTIEHKGHIATEFRAPIGNRIYGCDDCLAVCPWNKFAAASREAKLVARQDLRRPALGMLVRLDDQEFRRLFAGSPVKRIGVARFLRNVLIAIGNSRDPCYRDAVWARLAHPSALVRAMAVWAAGRVFARADIEAAEAAFVSSETDPEVLAEWQALLPFSQGEVAAERPDEGLRSL